MICHELSRLIACQNSSFKGFAAARNRKYHESFQFYLSSMELKVRFVSVVKHTQSSSLSEKKAFPLLENQPIDLMVHNQHSITRIYPAAYRQDSSNADPIVFWNVGIQMGSIFLSCHQSNLFLSVALNFQTSDLPMSLNHARFSDNNQCGYILKPAILRDRPFRDVFFLFFHCSMTLFFLLIFSSNKIQSASLFLGSSSWRTSTDQIGTWRQSIWSFQYFHTNIFFR